MFPRHNPLPWYVCYTLICCRYQFFLQLKQDLLTGRLECPYATSIEFAAAALQCKFPKSKGKGGPNHRFALLLCRFFIKMRHHLELCIRFALRITNIFRQVRRRVWYRRYCNVNYGVIGQLTMRNKSIQNGHFPSFSWLFSKLFPVHFQAFFLTIFQTFSVPVSKLSLPFSKHFPSHFPNFSLPIFRTFSRPFSKLFPGQFPSFPPATVQAFHRAFSKLFSDCFHM